MPVPEKLLLLSRFSAECKCGDLNNDDGLEEDAAY